MDTNVSDVLIDTIIDWGVNIVFGLPGDGINGIMEALRVRQDRIQFIQVRHEEAAAFMACAYAKYTGKLGCCLATSGPGGIHLLNGLYDAKMDQAPVLALTGQTFSDLKGSHFQQEVNMTLLFEDVTCYNQELINPNQIQMLANEACRHALNNRGVAHITLPVDYQVQPVTKFTSMHNRTGATNHVWEKPLSIPNPSLIEEAAEILNQSKRPVILIGQGARTAKLVILELADKLGAPIIKALLGKDVIPDEHPLTTGGLGLLGTEPSKDAIDNCDAILFIGTSFPYIDCLPKPGQAIGIQIDDKPNRIGLRYPVEVGLVGDAEPTVIALNKLVLYKEDRSFLTKAQNGMKEWWQLLDKLADQTAYPIKPELVAKELSSLLDNDAIISGDSGTNTTWIARHFKIRGSQKFSCSGTLSSMAPGLPYAIAGKLAFPKRQSVAFIGDGGFTMLMGEFATAVKYKLPILVIVLKNDVLGQIKWEQIVFLGNPEYGVELQSIDFAKFAQACGGIGFSVNKPEELRSTLQDALVCGKPALVEVCVDPFEPPMPPKVKLNQALNFAAALAKGQPDSKEIVGTIFENKIRELL